MKFTRKRVIAEIDEVILDLERPTTNPIIKKKREDQIMILNKVRWRIEYLK